MKKNISIAVAAIIVLVGFAAYFYWQNSQITPEPEIVQAPPPKPEPEVRLVIETPPEMPALPVLADSDSFIIEALSGLINNKSLMEFFINQHVIRHIVATIDNLPRKQAPMKVMPVKRVPGKFITTGSGDDLSISAKNAARYTPYVNIAEAVNIQKLVALYVHLYPLFQLAYEELGFPDKYFNDRLIVVIDDLLAAPDIREPIKLVQPGVYYLFADPDLEARSIGQRILMRTGSQNEAIIKARLQEIKQELKLHMHEQK